MGNQEDISMPVKVILDLPTSKPWKPVRLFKETENRWLPSNCHTLQVGTLDFFRNHYKGEIADPREGRPNFTINARGSWSEVASWANNTSYGLFGSFFPDWPKEMLDWPPSLPFAKAIEFPEKMIGLDGENLPGGACFKFQLFRYPTLDLVRMVCVASYSASNCFVYCLKRTEPRSDVLQEYDASWEISVPEINGFVMGLARTLIAENFGLKRADTDEIVHSNSLGPWQVAQLGSGYCVSEGPCLFYTIRDVVYTAQVETVYLSVNYPWDWSKNLMFNSAFFKGPDFSAQSETRIVFFLVLKIGDRMIALNPIDEKVVLPVASDLRSRIRERSS